MRRFAMLAVLLVLLLGAVACSTTGEVTAADTEGTPSAPDADESATSGASEAGTAEPAEDTTQRTAAATDLLTGAGPTGSHWPGNTPPYATSATTTVASLEELDETLARASSGDVIEVSPQVLDQPLEITSGDLAWEENVLVRPPLGERQSVVIDGELRLSAPHVTIAGLQVDGLIRGTASAERSNFARIVFGRDGSALLDGAERFGFYELVAPDYGVGGDRMQIRGTADGDAIDTVLAGVWLKGKFREIGADDHSDTVQLFAIDGGKVAGLRVEDSVLWTSADKSLQVSAGDTERLRIRNSFFNECSTNPVQPPNGAECPGYHAITGGGDAPSIRNSVVVGSIAVPPELPFAEVRNVAIQTLPPSEQAIGNRVTADLMMQPPPLPDLDEIWE